MFKEKGVPSIDEADLSKLDKTLFNTRIDEQRNSVTIGEVLVLGLLAFDRNVPENVIDAVCDSGNKEGVDLLRKSLEFWNSEGADNSVRKIFKDITVKKVADLIINKDAVTVEDSLRKRMSLQFAIASFGLEFHRSF